MRVFGGEKATPVTVPESAFCEKCLLGLPHWHGKSVLVHGVDRKETFGRKPTFKNIRTLTEQEVEALKVKSETKKN